MIDRFRVALASKIPQGSFARNVVTLMTGTTFAQALAIIVAPILTRLYSPEDFGILAVFTSIVGILSVISCGRYEIAIVVAEDDEEASSLAVLALVLGIVFGITILILIIIFKSWILTFNYKNIDMWIWILPVSLTVMAIYQVLNYWNIRLQEYRLLAKRQISQSISTAMVQIGLSVLELAERGLILGYVTGQCIATGMFLWQTIRTNWKSIVKKVTKEKLYRVLFKYKKFPLLDGWTSLLDNLTLAMPILFFTYIYDSNISGQLALTLKILAIPSALIGVSVSQVYYQRLTLAIREGEGASSIVEHTFAGLLGISICFCLLVVLVAPPLFPTVFGSSWVMAGQYARLLAPSICLRFVVSPLSSAFAAFNRLDLIALWKVIAVVITAGSLVLSIQFCNPTISVVFFTISDIALYCMYLIMIFKISKANITRSLTYSIRSLRKAYGNH